jgi:O-antigen biosynthesis protein
MWGKSARRANNSIIFRDSAPRAYETWSCSLVLSTLDMFRGDERLVFVYPRNEWAEGKHLEPNQLWGCPCLDATERALCIQPRPHEQSPQ